MAAANIQETVSDELNYELWAPIVKATLVEKGLWDVVENGVPPDPSTIPELAKTIQVEELSKWRDLALKDMKAIQLLQSFLTDSAFRKTLSASSAKEIWDLLKNGNSREIRQSRARRGECFQCGEQGHYARDCNHQIDQSVNEKPKHLLLTATSGDLTFDKDMWMLYSAASDHMTPYVKYFTTLDRRYRAGVELTDGSVIMAEGKGNVKIMMMGKKMTIENVLFVPGINRNVLSVGQMAKRGYSMESGGGECIIREETGKVFAKTRWEERGIALRLQVI